MKDTVMGIRDDAGGIHIKRVSAGQSLSEGVRALTQSIIARGRAPLVVLTCIPGGKS